MDKDDMIYNDLMWCIRNNTTIIAFDIRDEIFNEWESLSERIKRMITLEIEREISFNQCGRLAQKWKHLIEDLKKCQLPLPKGRSL